MTRLRSILVAVSLLALGPAACHDTLTVPNQNAPDRERALTDFTAVESLVSGAFRTWFEAGHRLDGVGLMLSAASFQHTSPSCWAPHSEIPRRPYPNAPLTGACTEIAVTWHLLYRSLASVAMGLGALEDRPELVTDATAAEAARLRALGRFVQGLGHGSLALLFDRAFVSDEHSHPVEREPLEYPAVMDTALAFLARAAELADGQDWPDIPAEWMSVAVSPDQLARLAHSYAARFRAAVARTPGERATVDWRAVIDDVDAGITGSWVMDMDPADGFYNYVVVLGSHPNFRNMDPYFVIGMGDQSASYQRWLDLPLSDRVPNPDSDGDGVEDPVLIVTPDTRFPRGSTVADQTAQPGSVFVVPDWIRNAWVLPARGTWRWSYYWHGGMTDYLDGSDYAWPAITIEEMRLLQAEARLRDADPAAAATLINPTRTAAGLAATDAAGANADCVPRLPDGTCGDLMEMLKWEKRLETRFQGPFSAPWFFDARGWGDLYHGTFLHFPIPCAELEVLRMTPCYTFGGPPPASGASSGSSYQWPGEA